MQHTLADHYERIIDTIRILLSSFLVADEMRDDEMSRTPEHFSYQKSAGRLKMFVRLIV